VIAEGEVLQLTAAQDLRTDEAIYLQVVRGKTAALFSAATEVGGVIAGAPRRRCRRCSTTATRWASPFRSSMTCWTMAARMRAIGKNTGDDFRERKLTLPVIKAVAAADP
jgi:octaprenyl-diphosphate synthase